MFFHDQQDCGIDTSFTFILYWRSNLSALLQTSMEK